MKTSKQQGFAPVLVVVAAAVLFVGAAAASYFGLLGNKPKELLNSVVPGASSLPKLQESDFANISDPLIRKHFAAQYSKSTFRVTSSSDGMGADSNTVVDVQYISDKDFRMHMSQVMDGKPAQETIMMGDTTYMKDMKDNSWWKQVSKPDEGEQSKGIDPKEFSGDEMLKELTEKTTVTYTNMGEEACGNLTCYKYEEKNSAEEGSSSRVFWFDTKDFLLRKEIHGYGEYTSQSEYSYDGVSVKEPSPVKDVPEGKSIYEMMAEGYMESQGLGEEFQTLKEMAPSKEELESMQNNWQNMDKEDYTTETSDIPMEEYSQ